MNNKEWLEKHYTNSNKSVSQLAKEIGIHHETVRRWLIRFSIPIKPKSIIQAGSSNPFYGKKHTNQTKEKMKGVRPHTSQESNHNWKGGKDGRGYLWREYIRPAILQRDKHTCQHCSKTKGLVIHHIIPWEKSRDNSRKNLITLCRLCHMKIHTRT